MILYEKTFEDITRANCNFPVEDQYYIGNNEVIIADGITRDPIGIEDLSNITPEELIEKYPKPSGSEMVAKLICKKFQNTAGTLKERLLQCNTEVKALNEKYVKQCDYLQNDYYSSVASCVRIVNKTLEYAYICDCGVIVYDKAGKIKFQTEDDKVLYSDPYIAKEIEKIPWGMPETRAKVRKEYRNNINNIQDGKCVSYGALTGETSVENFIRCGNVVLEEGDIIGIYSDGFVNYLNDSEFIKHILNFDETAFETYIKKKEKESYEVYGKEKTIILVKYEKEER